MSELDKIITILMKRDNISKNDARCAIESALSNARELISKGKWDDVDDKFYEDTGLEPDYLYALIV